MGSLRALPEAQCTWLTLAPNPLWPNPVRGTIVGLGKTPTDARPLDTAIPESDRRLDARRKQGGGAPWTSIRRACFPGAGLLAGAMNAAAGERLIHHASGFWSPPAFRRSRQTHRVPSALFPGILASVLAYREDFSNQGDVRLRTLVLVRPARRSCRGIALARDTVPGAFDAMVPWLLLIGSVAFAFGRQAGVALRRWVRLGSLTMVACQLPCWGSTAAISAGPWGS